MVFQCSDAKGTHSQVLLRNAGISDPLKHTHAPPYASNLTAKIRVCTVQKKPGGSTYINSHLLERILMHKNNALKIFYKLSHFKESFWAENIKEVCNIFNEGNNIIMF